MKAIFDKNKLLSEISPMLGVVSAKNTIAAIEGIKITTQDDKCELCAFDNEKGIKNHVDAEIIEAGSYIINAGKLHQILRVLPEGSVTIEISDRNVTKISSGISSFELHALPGDDFPVLPELGGEKGFTIEQAELKNMISKVMFAVGVNEPKPMLNGVYFKIDGSKITVVASDGQRLALKEKICDIDNLGGEELKMEFIIPGKSLSELTKLLSDSDGKKVKIVLGRRHVIFAIEDILFFTRMIDSSYLEYERFIPKNNRIFVKVSTDALLRSLERASLVTEERTMGQTKSPLRCIFKDGVLAFSSVSVSGKFYDEIPVEKTGDDIVIGFNCKFFIDAMRCVDNDYVTLSMSTPLMSMLIEPSESSDDDKFIYLVLPVRMRD